MNLKTGLYALILIFSFVFCGTGNSDKFTVVYKNGVRIVNNFQSKWDENNHKIDLQYIGKIGGNDEDDKNFIFYLPKDFELDSDGNIYILDNGNFRIQKFNPAGEFLLTIGQKGKGPNEIMNPKKFSISDENEIVVADWGNMSYKVFSKNGDLINNYSLANGNYQILLREFELLSNKNMIIPMSTSNNLIMLMNFDGDTLSTYGNVKTYKDNTLTDYKNLFRYCIDKSNNINLAYMHDNLIQKYSKDGILKLEITRPIDFEPEIFMPKFERKLLNGNLMIIRTEPNFGTISNGIGFDQKNRIWILSNSRKISEEEIPKVVYSLRGDLSNYQADELEKGLYKFDIFSKNGEYLEEISIPFYCDEFRIFDKRVYLLDTYRNMCLYIYELVEM